MRRAVLAALALRDQQLDLRADERAVLGPGDLLLERGEAVVALLDDLLRHLAVHLGRGRAGALGVLEGERRGEAGLAHDLEGLLEVGVRLAREADDDVRGDRRVRNGLADPLDDPEVAFAPVGAAHRPQHRVRSALQRHVQRGHDVGRLGHRLDHVVGEVARVRGGEADPLEALDRAAGTQQLGEGRAVAELGAVGVHVLPEQRDLDHALGHQRLDLAQDLAGAAVPLRAPQRGHDAEGAFVVAADGDRHPRRVRGFASGRERGREGLERLPDLELRLLLHAGTLQQDGQRADVVRAEHDVHPGRAPLHLAAVLLGQAAAHGDLHARLAGLDRGQVPEVAVEPVVRVLPHRAGVEDDDVRLPSRFGAHVARLFQQSGQALGVVHVHLAPVGADVVTLHIVSLRHGSRICPLADSLCRYPTVMIWGDERD